MIITEINQVGVKEVNQLQEISTQTFFETFSAENTEENMKKYLEEDLSIDKLTNELYNPNSEFYFAKQKDKVIGYMKINYGESQTELKDNKSVEIERIYVLKEFQGKNVGQQLYDFAIQIARQKNAEYVWLGVWERNLRAINFYRKNGFIEFSKHTFMLGNDKQTDIMMKLDLMLFS